MFAYRIEKPSTDGTRIRRIGKKNCAWTFSLRTPLRLTSLHNLFEARLAIDAIESDLKTDSCNGLGYSSVIGSNGAV